MNAERCPVMLVLEVVQDLESEVMVMGGVSQRGGGRGVRGDEGGKGRDIMWSAGRHSHGA